MRNHPEWLREYAYRKGCSRQFTWYGYDIRCGHDYILVRPLQRDCSVSLSYLTIKEAKRFQPKLVVIDPNTLEELVELNYREWHGLLFGYYNRKILVMPKACVLRIKQTPYRMGKEIRIVVGRDVYERWMRLVRNRQKDWEEILDELLTRSGY